MGNADTCLTLWCDLSSLSSDMGLIVVDFYPILLQMRASFNLIVWLLKSALLFHCFNVEKKMQGSIETASFCVAIPGFCLET